MASMDNQYYYKLMANYLSKKNCDESLMKYLFGKNSSKKTVEELERADERKRRLQRERSRRYRALKSQRRSEGGSTGREEDRAKRPRVEDENSDPDEPPTLCDLSYDERSSDDSSPPPQPPRDARDAARYLRRLLTEPNAELDCPTVHALMFHWLQT